MAADARAVAARFGWREIALRYLDVYREAMSRALGGSGSAKGHKSCNLGSGSRRF